VCVYKCNSNCGNDNKKKEKNKKKRSEKIGIFQIKILVCVKTVPWKKKQSFLLLK
jgi:hypothetical protein